MAVKMVHIVNPNGRKGEVAETSTAASTYKQPPSTRVNGSGKEVEMPAGNASTEAWRDYALADGMSSDTAEEMTRGQLAAHYMSEED